VCMGSGSAAPVPARFAALGPLAPRIGGPLRPTMDCAGAPPRELRALRAGCAVTADPKLSDFANMELAIGVRCREVAVARVNELG
jgi:hypothetical protein